MLLDGVHASKGHPSQWADHRHLQLGLLGGTLDVHAAVLLEHLHPPHWCHEVVRVEDDPVTWPLELGRVHIERDQVQMHLAHARHGMESAS